ncbi:MAG: hypothetical protein EON54_07700 [Alcaligenaceae bacterium]|nr:MAG: hypothetical protein EON54_07700 [Alcaligenaceae bacterium]
MRFLFLLLGPLLSIGAIYMFGWIAIIVMLLMLASLLVFSSRQVPNPPSQTHDSTLSTYGAATTRIADI